MYNIYMYNNIYITYIIYIIYGACFGSTYSNIFIYEYINNCL